MQRQHICSVKRGWSAPNICARMAERMPSAPMTASPSASLPSAKRATAHAIAGGRTDAGLAQADDVVRQRRTHHAVQVGPVRSHVGRAVFLGRDRLERLARAQAGVVPLDRDHVDRLEGVAAKLVFQPERAEYLDRVRADLDAGADLLEPRRTFVDLDLDAALAQRDRRREPADAAAHDDDPKRTSCASNGHSQVSSACAIAPRPRSVFPVARK